MLHIVNGDSLGNKIQHISSNILVWREMYDLGPMSHAWEFQEWTRVRAEYFEKLMNIPTELFIETSEQQYKQLREVAPAEDITFWFDHDRYDQTMLMAVLHYLTAIPHRNLFMVTTPDFASQTAEQLTILYKQRQRITKVELEEAVSGWKAYTSANPRNLEKWIDEQNHALPYLQQAMKVHITLFPSQKNGLNEVEDWVLNCLLHGKQSFSHILTGVNQLRSGEGLSDLHLAALLRQLTYGEVPLIEIEQKLPTYKTPVSSPICAITQKGTEVLLGQADRIEAIGIDWWLGGVHLTDDIWRCNDHGRLHKKG